MHGFIFHTFCPLSASSRNLQLQLQELDELYRFSRGIMGDFYKTLLSGHCWKLVGGSVG